MTVDTSIISAEIRWGLWVQLADVKLFRTSVCNDSSEQVRLDFVLVLCVQQVDRGYSVHKDVQSRTYTIFTSLSNYPNLAKPLTPFSFIPRRLAAHKVRAQNRAAPALSCRCRPKFWTYHKPHQISAEMMLVSKVISMQTVMLCALYQRLWIFTTHQPLLSKSRPGWKMTYWSWMTHWHHRKVNSLKAVMMCSP